MDITNAELARRIDAGVATFKDELRGVHRRLDSQARTLNDHATELRDHAVELAVLAVQKAQAQQLAAPKASGEKEDATTKPITRWDLTVFVAGVYLLLEVLPKIRPLILGAP